MTIRFKNTLVGAFLLLVGAAAALALRAARTPDEGEHEGSKPTASRPAEVSMNPRGEVVVALTPNARKQLGIESAALVAANVRSEAVAYGTLEADPARTFTLRATISAFVRTAGDTAWPRLGAMIPDGATIGALEPRLTPVERADLASRLESSRSEAAETEADLKAARASYEAKRDLNASNKIVPDRQVDEAKAKVEMDEARLRAASETIRLIEAALVAEMQPSAMRPLSLPRGGEVVEIAVQPGESVEPGQLLLRVARYDRMIASVALAVADSGVPVPTTPCRVELLGDEEHPLEGRPIGLRPTADPQTRGPAYLFAVDCGEASLRPGAAVIAYVPLPGEPQKGCMVPRSAVVRFQGQAWVYVEGEGPAFVRREILLDRPRLEGWFVSLGVRPGERVVVRGAAALLGAEIRASTSGAGEGEEE